MCKAIRDGGNRCPKHRHDSIALVQLASEASGMTKEQAEDMFVQLRREGRNPEIVSREEWHTALTKIDEAIEASDSEDKEALKARMTKARTHGHQPSKATVYAMGLLIGRSKERGQNLENRLKEMAETSGFTTQEVKEKFAAEYAAVDRSRGAAVPPEYNQSSVRYATLANLPHDRSTVTALAKVQSAIQHGPRRVTRASMAGQSSFIHEAGYDNGRLEISFNDQPNTVYAYRDVPASVWERMQEGSAGSIYAREIRGNADYLYDTAEEAENDAYTVRCSSCGQFTARTGHSCPQRVERERIEAATGRATPNVDENARLSPDTVIESEANNDVEKTTEVLTSDPMEEAPYVDPETLVDADMDESDDAIATPTEDTESSETQVESEDVEVEMLDDRNGFLTITGPKNVFSDHVPTPENQRRPEPYEFPEGAKIEKTVLMSQVQSYEGTADNGYEHMFSSSYYLTSKLSDEEKDIVRSAGTNIRFIVGKEHEGSDVTKILDIYDSKQFNCIINASYRYRFEDGVPVVTPSTYVFTRKPQIVELATYTPEEKTEIVRSLNENTRAQIEGGEAVEVNTNQAVTSKFKIDASVESGFGVRFAKAHEFRRAIKDDKIAVVKNTYWDVPSTVNDMDDQGYFVGTRRTTVSGDMAFKRNASGVVEVVSDERQLRCSCRDYRLKYNCPHINYIQRHAGNVAQQTLPAPRTHRLLTVALSGRSDVSVVEPKGVAPFIRFDTSNMTRTSRSFSPSASASIPNNLRPADPYNPTVSELLAVQNFNATLQNITRVDVPANTTQVRSAVRRSDVEMPVEVRFYEPRRGLSNAQVTGAYLLRAGEDERIDSPSHTLKCTCAEYAETYSCIHVRAMEDQHEMFINSNTRNAHVRNSITDFERNNLDAWREAEDIGVVMQRYGETEEQAQERIRIRRENEELRNREREERLRVDNEQYESRNRARREAEERRLAEEHARREEEQAELVEGFKTYRKERKEAWGKVESPYAENPTEFKKVIDEALERKKKGEAAIPFKTENVTDGVAGVGPGTRAFGVEIEFDIKRGVNKAEALSKIGEELYAAGLTPTSYQQHYHSAAYNGYQKWSFEKDQTVHAELVSPIMKDTPEHWEELRQVIEIVERNGGVASTRAGSHVHVSSGSYQTKVAPHAELLRTFNDNEDIMYRMSSSPKRGKHRGTRWCQPNTNDTVGEISKEDARSIRILGQHSHALGLNFESANNYNWKKANVEFRLWDSTLDAGVIQQQVAMSVAMTDYAERKVEADGSSKIAQRNRKPIGHGRRKENMILDAHSVTKHNEETFKESHAEAAAFFDKMFRTKEQRDSAAALFAVTKWQRD